MNYAPMAILKILKDRKKPFYIGGGCYTLKAHESQQIKANRIVSVPIGAYLLFPPSHFALITQANDKLLTLAGVIDSDYRGEIQVIGMATEDLVVEENEVAALLIVLELGLFEIES